MSILVNGLVTGIVFGFLLQKGRVVRYDKQIGALRFMDMTIVKFMFSAILVGMVGVALVHNFGLAKPGILPTVYGANIIGGLLFGVGWGVNGYCPGTAVGAVGEGRVDALFSVLGMIVGAGIYAEAYPVMERTVLSWGREGSIALPQVLGVSKWIVIGAFLAGGIFLFRFFEKKNL